MNAIVDHSAGLRARKAMQHFIEEHLCDSISGWPRRSVVARSARERRGCSVELGPRVLVVGDLSLEFPIDVQGTTAALLAKLDGRERNLAWRIHEPRVGGFAAHAARAAAALHAQVTICTTLPVPIPSRLLKFLRENDPNAELVSALPASGNFTLAFRCSDGVVLRHIGTMPKTEVLLNKRYTRDFDAVVMDTDSGCASRAVHRSAPLLFNDQLHASTVALHASWAWTDADIRLAQHPRSWTFLRGQDARRILHGTGHYGSTASDISLARRVQVKFQIPRMALRVGPNVALLQHDLPDVRWVRACPIRHACEIGTEETLLTVTALSSAAGADDVTSLNRGLAAATGFAAGLELPRRLDELDAG